MRSATNELQRKMKNEKRKMQNDRARSRIPFFIFHFSFFIFSCSFMTGCFESAGIGGTGEIVVPKERLRDVEPFDPAKMAATQPATTQPATRPVLAQAELPT